MAAFLAAATGSHAAVSAAHGTSCELGRSPAFPRLLPLEAMPNGRYGLGYGGPISRPSCPGAAATVLRLLAEELFDPGDRLVDRLLWSDPLGGDPVDRLRPGKLLPDPVVPPIAQGLREVVSQRARAD